MSKPAVIYAFRSPGSGAVYIGKHQCDPEGWPRRGTGPLPDGYRGSGVVVANFHRRHGAAVQWRILAAVTGDREAVNAAERRAIRLARALFGRGCVNRTDGGDGFSSDESRAHMANPGVKATHSAAMKEAANRPAVRAKNSAKSKARVQTAEGAEAFARACVAATAPEALTKLSAKHKVLAQTPERKAQLDRATALNSTPEAIAKRQRTRRANDSWRLLAAERPELFEWTQPLMTTTNIPGARPQPKV